MASTADLTAIRAHAEAAGAKLLLTGDHRQLAAIGAGGGMELVAEVGITHELAEVRRFAEVWERAASLRLREGDPTALHDYRKHGRLVDGGTAVAAEAAASRAYIADVLAGRHSLLIADTNEAADRISAGIRAELVRLGRVQEDGVPLSLQGTVAGVGDVVQARRNGWHLAGHDGNHRGPINRERYRVVEAREDGSLVVTPLTGHGATDGSERMALPTDYVAEHVALGYASTVHSAQGLTVDTCHTVVTSRTGPAGLYVGLSRGRDANTAYVTTIAVPDDSPTGSAAAERRDVLTVLLSTFEAGGADRAAVAEAEASDAEARSLRTAAERFADVAEQATATRTAALLDHLTDDGLLTAHQRQTIAADEAMPMLAQVLRRAEIAGHDPHEVLAGAARLRTLDRCRSLASVLHHRVVETTSLDPAGDSFAEWIPAVDDPAWRSHLAELAAAADRRRAELGAEVRDGQPQWAIEALGPVPANPVERHDWQRRAGIAAAHRELSGHEDDSVALPGPPKPGQVEAYASWRAAWRALGRPESDRAEAEMSDGQLRVRVRAYEREKAWEPPYVAHELSGTSQAEARQRQLAQLRDAEAAAAQEPADGERLRAEAKEAAALADVLASRRVQLAEADNVRALWYAHTAETRAAEQRARAELGARGIDPDEPEDATTVQEWLAAHAVADRLEDPHRAVTDELDLADVAKQRDADLSDAAVRDEPNVNGRTDQPSIAEAAAPDIRQEAAHEPARREPVERDWTSVPTAEQTAEAVARARRALIELEQRQAAEKSHAAEEVRAAELTRWSDVDRAAGHLSDAREDDAPQRARDRG